MKDASRQTCRVQGVHADVCADGRHLRSSFGILLAYESHLIYTRDIGNAAAAAAVQNTQG